MSTSIKENISKNIAKYRKEKGLSQNALAEMVGAKNFTTVSSWERGISSPDADTIIKLCKIFDKTLYDLYEISVEQEALSSAQKDLLQKYIKLDSHGKEAVDSIIDIEWKRMLCKSEQPKAEVIELDFSNYKASAGTGYFLLDEDTKKISVYSNPTTRKADICIAVSGDSMIPKFHDGDILLVRKQPDVLQGEIGIFLRGNEAFVKKKGKDQLLSLNPDYPNIFDDGDNLITCYGKIINKLEKEWIVK